MSSESTGTGYIIWTVSVFFDELSFMNVVLLQNHIQ